MAQPLEEIIFLGLLSLPQAMPEGPQSLPPRPDFGWGLLRKWGRLFFSPFHLTFA